MAEPPVHRVLGHLGLGECQRQRGLAPTEANAALALSTANRFAFGAIHAHITLGLADPSRAPAAEYVIQSSAFPAPVRSDSVTGLARYCLGPDPRQHRIAFP